MSRGLRWTGAHNTELADRARRRLATSDNAPPRQPLISALRELPSTSPVSPPPPPVMGRGRGSMFRESVTCWWQPGHQVREVLSPGHHSPLSGSPLGLCSTSTHESSVKFDSSLTQMSRVRVESAVKIRDMSRVRVESRWSSCKSELSQLDTAWVKVYVTVFRTENVKVLHLSGALQGKNQPKAALDPPPPSPSFGQIRQNVRSRQSDLTQLWIESDLSQVSKFEIWVESELTHQENQSVDLRLSWITWIVTWIIFESARKIWVEYSPGQHSHISGTPQATKWPVSESPESCLHVTTVMSLCF